MANSTIVPDVHQLQVGDEIEVRGAGRHNHGNVSGELYVSPKHGTYVRYRCKCCGERLAPADKVVFIRKAA